MSDPWALPPLTVGDFAPDFWGATRGNPKFYFSTLPGRYVLLALMPREPQARAAALSAFETVRPRFDDRAFAAFFVAEDPDPSDVPEDRIPGQRWFLDPGRAIAPHFAATGHGWFLFDPMLRLLASSPIEQPEAVLKILERLPSPATHAGGPLVAPVLIVPRVFEPELCRRLVEYYETRGGEPSGVMRDIDGRTVGVLDTMKRRSDVLITEPEIRRELMGRLERNLAPMIRRTFQFNPTRLERYLVACYDAAEGGYFQPHRDNETLGTAHRRFAVSINLNAEEFEGGDLRFPEFGARTYRPPTGGAVVFCCALQHEATRVTAGRRYAFLPFLYDEAGQRIREQNQAFMQQGAAATGSG